MAINQEIKNQYAVLDIGGSFIKYGYGNDNNLCFNDKKKVSDIKDLELFCSALDECLSELFTHNLHLSAICIGCPGTIDNKKGCITGVIPNLPFLKDFNFKEYLQPKFQIPVFIENDANLAALGESYYYPNQSLLAITIGTGIGSGLITNNTIYHGDSFAAMELGHTIVIAEGRKCKCGKHGCVEAYSSANSMLDIIRDKYPQYQFETIYNLMVHSTDNPEIMHDLHILQDQLALALSNAITLLNPSVLVIGGGVIEIEEYDFLYLKNKILDLLHDVYKNVLIKKAHNYNLAGLLGGLYLCRLNLE